MHLLLTKWILKWIHNSQCQLIEMEWLFVCCGLRLSIVLNSINKTVSVKICVKKIHLNLRLQQKGKKIINMLYALYFFFHLKETTTSKILSLFIERKKNYFRKKKQERGNKNDEIYSAHMILLTIYTCISIYWDSMPENKTLNTDTICLKSMLMMEFI